MDVVVCVNIDEEAAEIIEDVLIETRREKTLDITERRKALAKKMNELEVKLAAAQDALFTGTITAERFKSTASRYQAELDGITEQEARLRGADVDFVSTGVRLLELIKCLETTIPTKSAYEQGELLRILCSNIATDGVSISATDQEPFDVLADRLEEENRLPGLDVLRTIQIALPRVR